MFFIISKASLLDCTKQLTVFDFKTLKKVLNVRIDSKGLPGGDPGGL